MQLPIVVEGVLDFLEDNQIAAWIGVAITVVATVITGITSLFYIALVCVLIGAGLTVLVIWASARKAHPIMCQSMDITYTLNGVRGASADVASLEKYLFRNGQHGFSVATRRTTGKLAGQKLEYRNCGRRGRTGNGAWHTVDADQILERRCVDGSFELF